MAEYQRGEGPDALPQGAATAANEATPDFGDPSGELALENPDIPVLYASGDEDVEPDDSAPDMLKLLLQPRDPGFQNRVVPRDRPGRVPRYVVRHLPQLRAAALAPDAPPALMALYKATIRHLERERRGGR